MFAAFFLADDCTPLYLCTKVATSDALMDRFKQSHGYAASLCYLHRC